MFKEEAKRLDAVIATKPIEDTDCKPLILQKKIIELYFLISKMAPIPYDKNDRVQLRHVVLKKAESLKEILELLRQLHDEFKIIGNNLITYIPVEAQIRIKNGNFKFSYFLDNLMVVLTDASEGFKTGNYYASLQVFDGYFNCKEFLDELQIVNDFCLAYFDALSLSIDKHLDIYNTDKV